MSVKARRQHRLAMIELLVAGVSLAAAVGYALQGSVSGAVIAILVAGLLIGHAVVQRAVASSWLIALGFFASLSKLDVSATERAFGDLRVPIMVGGSALALLIGVLAERSVRMRQSTGP